MPNMTCIQQKQCFAGGRWMYVIFMCQQALEKLVKSMVGDN
jgi:HEPN domain-containing protein